MAYATVTGKITPPGTPAGVPGQLEATPLVAGTFLPLPAENRANIGPAVAQVAADGTLTPSLSVPIIAGVVWRFHFVPKVRRAPKIYIGDYEIPASTDVADLIPVQLEAITPTVANNIAAAAALGATNDTATASFVDDDDSATAAALSARIATQVTDRAVVKNPGTTGAHVGDSFTVGYGVTSAEKYAALLDTSKGLSSANNLAVNGNMVWDQDVALFNRATVAGEQNTILLGFNDYRAYAADATKRAEFAKAYAAVAWWLATPDTAKTFWQSATFSGTWTATNAYATSGARQVYATSVNGASVTAFVEGRTAYFMTIAQDGNDVAYSITVDGKSYGTHSGETTGMTTVRGKTYGPRLHRFAGLSDGPHTIVVTKTSGAELLYFVAAGGTNFTRSTTAPTLVCGQVSRMTTAGYVTLGGSDAIAAQYNDEIARVVRNLQADGLNVAWAETGIKVPEEVSADNIHPTPAGHIRIANAFTEALSRWPYARDRRSPIPGTEMVGVKVTRATTTSIASGSLVPVTWDGEDYDTTGFHDLSSTPSRLYVPPAQGGYYRVDASLSPSGTVGTSATRVSILIYVNSALANGGVVEIPGGVRSSPTVSTTLLLKGGDYVEAQLFQNSGSAYVVAVGSAMSMTKVGNP